MTLHCNFRSVINTLCIKFVCKCMHTYMYVYTYVFVWHRFGISHMFVVRRRKTGTPAAIFYFNVFKPRIQSFATRWTLFLVGIRIQIAWFLGIEIVFCCCHIKDLYFQTLRLYYVHLYTNNKVNEFIYPYISNKLHF